MSHALTEVATFDPTVTVPDGTDSGAVRAANVTAISQVLANRSRYLKNLADGAAQKSGGNTFTGTNNFAALTATSLVVTPGATTLGALTAGVTTLGDVTAGVATLGAVTAPSYANTVPLLRQLVIDLRTGTAIGFLLGSGLPQAFFVEAEGVIFSQLGGGGGAWAAPLVLPHGGVISANGIRVIFNQAGANAVTFNLMESQINWTTGALTHFGIGDPNQSFGTTGNVVTNLVTPAYSVDRQNKVLWVIARSLEETSSAAWRGLRVTYSDLGPSSHWQ